MRIHDLKHAGLAALALLAVSATAAERDYSILIRGHRLQPTPGSAVAAAVGNPQQRVAWIIQFKGPLTRKQTALLKERFGLRLDESIPRHAFLERLTPPTLAELRKLDFFRWSGRYEPSFKIDPMIGKHQFRTESRRAERGILLSVDAFPGTDIPRLAGRVRALGFEVLSTTDEPRFRIHRLQVRVRTPADAKAIACFEEVRSIEETGEVTLNE